MSLSDAQKEKLQRGGHILAGFIILIHAYEKYEHHASSYIYFLILGLVFLFIALIHKKLTRFHHYVDSTFLIIEAIAIGIIAVDFFEEGKKALPLCYVFAAILYVAAACIKYRKNKAMHH